MQMAYVDKNDFTNDDEEGAPEDRMDDLRKRLAGFLTGLSLDDLSKVLDMVEAQIGQGTDDIEKEKEMTNTLGTDAKADRISTDDGFRKSVREAAEATNRRIAVDDRMEADQRNLDSFASRYGANGTRIKVDHAGVQGIPERSK